MICSYSYYDAFHQGQAAFWQWMFATAPDPLVEMYSQFPVPRATAPRLQLPDETKREPYYDLPPREIDPEILQQLNLELEAGTHPTTEALTPLGLRFLKVLGAGTYGTAVLFEMDNEDGTKRKIVAKYETGGDDDEEEGLLDEKEWMRVSIGQGLQSTIALPSPIALFRHAAWRLM